MTYVFDLDGTLCDTIGDDYANARPVPHRIAEVNQLWVAGHRIVIDTARGSGSGIDWRELTERQLATWGVQYDLLRVGAKLPADVYVDDRAVSAAGFFKDAN